MLHLKTCVFKSCDLEKGLHFGCTLLWTGAGRWGYIRYITLFSSRCVNIQAMCTLSSLSLCLSSLKIYYFLHVFSQQSFLQQLSVFLPKLPVLDHSFQLLHSGQSHLPKTSRHDSSTDWLLLANRRFEQQVGGAPVLTARYRSYTTPSEEGGLASLYEPFA